MKNNLKEEVVEARSVHQMKEKLYNYRYGDGTNGAWLGPGSSQIGKYAHTHTPVLWTKRGEHWSDIANCPYLPTIKLGCQELLILIITFPKT